MRHIEFWFLDFPNGNRLFFLFCFSIKGFVLCLLYQSRRRNQSRVTIFGTIVIILRRFLSLFLGNLPRLEQFFKLLGGEGFAFHKGLSDKLQLVTVLRNNLTAGLIGVFEVLANFLINFAGYFFGIVAFLMEVAA